MEGVEGSLNGKPLIRTIESRDVGAILAIQGACPEVAQWTASDYERVADGEMAGWVAEEDDRVVGFLVARHIVSDIEILNLAVLGDARRRGIGTSLLQHSLEWGIAFQAEKAILEVRRSNLQALGFYERHHFEAIARRPRYYTAPAEDALLLRADLLPR
jgi:ribosomal-protein-alanine N-acetyltransferase